MSELKTIMKRLALKVGKWKVVRNRLRGIDNLHGLLQRQTIFEHLGIDLVVDVGANKGQFGKEIRDFYKGEIISFEPVANAFAELIKTSSTDSRWHPKQLALGSVNEVRSINVAEHNEFSSFLKTSSYCSRRFGAESGGKIAEAVTVRRLDDVLEELVPSLNTKKSFLKLDTQGYDMQVLNGLGSKLGCFAAIQCEVSVIPIYEDMPHWTECISFLERAGFGIVGLLPVNIDHLSVVEFDCLMVKV